MTLLGNFALWHDSLGSYNTLRYEAETFGISISLTINGTINERGSLMRRRSLWTMISESGFESHHKNDNILYLQYNLQYIQPIVIVYVALVKQLIFLKY